MASSLAPFSSAPSELYLSYTMASILILRSFYTSGELAVRLGLFWSTLNLARILSALLAAGILKMRGIAGLAGWQWLFFLEGKPVLHVY